MFAALFLPILILAAFGVFHLGSFLLKSPEGHPPLSKTGAILQKRLRLAGVIILAAGLLAAGVIYASAPAEETDGGAIGYEIDGSTASPMAAGDSKSYDQQMDGMGGTVSVLETDLRNWLHGQKLAYTVAFLSLSGAAVCFIFAQLQAYAAPVEKP